MYENHIQFFTATILEWKHLLKKDEYKLIIVNSLRKLAELGRIKVYGFVIMPNHIHLIWHISDLIKAEDLQRDFLKFTAQQIRFDLKKNHPDVLAKFQVNAKDREYQFWERNSLSVNIYSREVLIQKLDYIHNNPVQEKWHLCLHSEDYKYSSARYYICNVKEWEFLTHFVE
jgi:REP element-mobilizing transposase RayT